MHIMFINVITMIFRIMSYLDQHRKSWAHGMMNTRWMLAQYKCLLFS